MERDYSASISGRSNDVPDPDASPARISWTLEKKQREARLQTRDVGYITSGADTAYTPNGLRWDHQRVETAVVIEYRAANRSNTQGSVYADPYNRLYGERTGGDGIGAPDDWDGITGETLRVILAQRKGISEWDRVGTDSTGAAIEVRDLSDLGGVNYYRADVWIPMDIVAQAIDTST